MYAIFIHTIYYYINDDLTSRQLPHIPHNLMKGVPVPDPPNHILHLQGHPLGVKPRRMLHHDSHGCPDFRADIVEVDDHAFEDVGEDCVVGFEMGAGQERAEGGAGPDAHPVLGVVQPLQQQRVDPPDILILHQAGRMHQPRLNQLTTRIPKLDCPVILDAVTQAGHHSPQAGDPLLLGQQLV